MVFTTAGSEGYPRDSHAPSHQSPSINGCDPTTEPMVSEFVRWVSCIALAFCPVIAGAMIADYFPTWPQRIAAFCAVSFVTVGISLGLNWLAKRVRGVVSAKA